MRLFSKSAVIVVAIGVVDALSSQTLCGDSAVLDAGNWYCKPVNKISYKNVFQHAGTYPTVTDMSNGVCRTDNTNTFNGPLAPLDDEISVHFRAPFVLKQFAAYVPTPTTSSEVKRNLRHGHHHFQNKARVTDAPETIERRAVGDLVVIPRPNGDVWSWINEYDGHDLTAPQAHAASTAAGSSLSQSLWAFPSGWSPPEHLAQAAGRPQSSAMSEKLVGSTSVVPTPPKSRAAAQSSAASHNPAASPGSGSWTRVGYYNAEDEQSSNGLVFLNNKGGQGSGVFDLTFGSSSSYASTDGCSGASEATFFGGNLTTVSGSQEAPEIFIVTDKICGDNDGCGYVLESNGQKSVAYHGFGGPSKAFFVEFMMPDDGTIGWNMNMPAWWLLNARIPRTLQYGGCSCWPGCGEFDIFEVLDSGNMRCKSTLHGPLSGGDFNYFNRPTDKLIKAAIIMYDNNIHIKVLDDSVNFDEVIAASEIADICEDDDNSEDSSVFAIAG